MGLYKPAVTGKNSMQSRHPDVADRLNPTSQDLGGDVPDAPGDLHREVLARQFVLDGSGPAYLEPPSLDLWPDVHWQPDYNKSTKVNLDTLTPAEVATWKPGQTLLLSGKMLTGRDAAHKRIQDMLAKGEKLPVDFTDRVIYYVGPVDPVRDEVMGPAGTNTVGRWPNCSAPARSGTLASPT